jgi:hypothetical protein
MSNYQSESEVQKEERSTFSCYLILEGKEEDVLKCIKGYAYEKHCDNVDGECEDCENDPVREDLDEQFSLSSVYFMDQATLKADFNGDENAFMAEHWGTRIRQDVDIVEGWAPYNGSNKSLCYRIIRFTSRGGIPDKVMLMFPGNLRCLLCWCDLDNLPKCGSLLYEDCELVKELKHEGVQGWVKTLTYFAKDMVTKEQEYKNDKNYKAALKIVEENRKTRKLSSLPSTSEDKKRKSPEVLKQTDKKVKK